MLLITGSTGNSGSHLMRELESAENSDPVRCLVRRNTDIASLQTSSLSPEILVGDLEDQGFLDRACQGVDTVMHIASIKFSLGILRAALKNNVRRVVLVHTTGIYSHYKSAAEEYIQIERELSSVLSEANQPIDVVVLRPTMIFGQPRDSNMSVFIRMVDRLRVVPIINNGDSLLQPVHGRDLGRGFSQALWSQRLPETEYVLSGERPVTMREMLTSIAELLGKRTYFINIPLPLGVFAAQAMRIATLGKMDMVERVQRMGEDRCFPHDAAKRDFAYAPEPFIESLQREVEMYKSKRGKA